MQNPSPQPNQNPFDDQPIVAELVTTSFSNEPKYSPPPTRSPLWPLLGCGGVIAVLIVLAVGGLFYAVSRLDGFTQAAVLPNVDDPKRVLTSFDGTWHLGPTSQGELRKAIAALEQAHQQSDRAAFQRLVSWDHHLQRTYAKYRFQPLDFVDRTTLARLQREDFSMPHDASDFKLAEVTFLDENTVIAGTYPQAGAASNTPHEFLFVRVGRAWKLVDWRDVANFRWSAEYSGVTYGPLEGDYRGDEYRTFIDEMIASDAAVAKEDLDQSTALLRRAEQRNVLPEFADYQKYMLALRWAKRGEYEEAKRLSDLIIQPDLLPCAHELRCYIYSALDDYETAAAAAEAYERVAGFQADLIEERIQAYSHLNKKDLAAADAIRLVRYNPQNHEAISLALNHLDANSLDELLPLLPNTKESLARVVSTALAALYREDMAMFDRLRGVVAQSEGHTAELLELDAERLHFTGDLEQAVEKYRERIAHVEEKEQQYALFDFLTLAARILPVEEIYQSSSQPRQIMRALFVDDEEGEIELPAGALEKLLSQHRRREPTDPWLPYYEASQAMERKAYTTAIPLWQQALAKLGEEAEEYQQDEMNFELVRAFYHSGRWAEAYRRGNEPEKTFKQLFNLLSEGGQWDELQQLAELHRQKFPDDPWLQYTELRRAEATARKSDDQAALQDVIEKYRALEKTLKPEGDYLVHQVTSRIRQAEKEIDWVRYWEAHTNPEGAYYDLYHFLRRRGDQAEVEKFLALFRAKFPNDPNLLTRDVEDAWSRGDDAAVIAKLSPWPPKSLDKLYLQGDLREKLVISLLRAGRNEDAFVAASQPQPDHRLQALIRIAEGNPGAGDYLDQAEKEESYWHFPLSRDWRRFPLLGQAVISESGRSLRNNHPPRFSPPWPTQRFVIFYREPMKWDLDRVRAAFAQEGNAPEIDWDVIKSDTEEWYIGSAGETRLMITQSQQPYASPQKLTEAMEYARLRDKELEAVIDLNRA